MSDEFPPPLGPPVAGSQGPLLPAHIEMETRARLSVVTSVRDVYEEFRQVAFVHRPFGAIRAGGVIETAKGLIRQKAAKQRAGQILLHDSRGQVAAIHSDLPAVVAYVANNVPQIDRWDPRSPIRSDRDLAIAVYVHATEMAGHSVLYRQLMTEIPLPVAELVGTKHELIEADRAMQGFRVMMGRLADAGAFESLQPGGLEHGAQPE